MYKRAIILAGGKGTRLKPYTITIPKPLVPIGDRAILEIIIIQLIKCGFCHITITVNHLSDLIKAFFGDGSKWGIKIDYTHEEKPLSTMGPLTLINDLPEDFLVMNGDVLTDLDFSELYRKHIAGKNLFTISSYKRIDKIDYGVLESNNKDELIGFSEKPEFTFNVSMGVYLLNKKVLDYIPKDTPYGFDDLMLKLIRKNKKVNLYNHNGYWLDIGRPDDYEKAVNDFSDLEIVK